jgi:hypothetical protein
MPTRTNAWMPYIKETVKVCTVTKGRKRAMERGRGGKEEGEKKRNEKQRGRKRRVTIFVARMPIDCAINKAGVIGLVKKKVPKV